MDTFVTHDVGRPTLSGDWTMAIPGLIHRVGLHGVQRLHPYGPRCAELSGRLWLGVQSVRLRTVKVRCRWSASIHLRSGEQLKHLKWIDPQLAFSTTFPTTCCWLPQCKSTSDHGHTHHGPPAHTHAHSTSSHVHHSAPPHTPN
jgi:hypothetical protein